MADIVINRFEIVRAEDADVMVCFIGRADIAEGAQVMLDGQDLVVGRGKYPALRFAALAVEHVDWVRQAPNLYMRRSGIEDVRVGVRLVVAR